MHALCGCPFSQFPLLSASIFVVDCFVVVVVVVVVIVVVVVCC